MHMLCRLLECWAALPVPLGPPQVQAGHQGVEESLRSPSPDIQAAAVATLHAFSRAYLPQLGHEVLLSEMPSINTGCEHVIMPLSAIHISSDLSWQAFVAKC